MKISQRDQRIAIQRRTVTGQNTSGEDIIDWTVTTFPRWAKVTALSGNELFRAQQVWADARFRVELAYHDGDGIQTQDRILWGARTLDILSAEDSDSGKVDFAMVCKEIK